MKIDILDKLNSKNIASQFSLLLILMAFAIILIGGRWGAYIRSPVSGLFLPDMLLGMGAIGAIFCWRQIFSLHPILKIAFSVVGFYLFVRLFDSFVFDPVATPYLAIRDLAPFGYLLLTPLLALAIQHLEWPYFLLVVRIATALNLLGYELAGIGLLMPFSSGLLGGEQIRFFEYRSDLAGAIFGIGLLAWGRWPASSPSRLAQLTFVLAGCWLDSRAGLLTLLLCGIFAFWREHSWPQSWRKPLLLSSLGLGIVVSFTVAGYLFLSWASSQDHPKSPAALSKDYSDLDWMPPVVNKQLKQFGESGNTLTARLNTWESVLQGISQDRVWLFGGGIGSDILHSICASDKSMILRFSGGGITRPKCAVDSNDAPTVLRDPHNWLLNLILYHGVIGTLIFIFAVLLPIWLYRHSSNSSLSIVAIFAYFICGTFGVILSAPFGMLPIAIFLAWLMKDAFVHE